MISKQKLALKSDADDASHANVHGLYEEKGISVVDVRKFGDIFVQNILSSSQKWIKTENSQIRLRAPSAVHRDVYFFCGARFHFSNVHRAGL